MKTQHLEYIHQNDTLEAFIAFDEQITTPKPLVLISHAWGGRDQFVCDKAIELAKLGYVGFALDMYGKGVLGQSKEENGNLIAPFINDRAFLRARIQEALATASTLPYVDASRIAAIGYCFGGLCVLDLARSGADIKGVVSFHGLLVAPENMANETITAKVLALHGFDDPMVPPEQVLAFENEMTKAGVDWQLHAYGQTTHAFTNPEANDPDFGTVFNQAANRRSWQSMQNFLKELLG